MAGIKDELKSIGAHEKERFMAERRVLSFQEYLELVEADPWAHTRDASRYLRDCLDHFGSYAVQTPGESARRWKVFDLDFGASKSDHHAKLQSRDRLIGHHALQESLYRVLENFEREGRANRLVLLHGPNGSAKSTFVACLMSGLEAYSQVDEGALYRFSWVFPRSEGEQGIGFSTASDTLTKTDSFAHLPEERIAAKLQSGLREHPLLVLPREVRQEFIERVYRDAELDKAAPDWVWSNQLSRENQQIFEALLTSYRGDLNRVLAHIQVERFYISKRYRAGAVTIGPEMAVDAQERQLTADHSLEALPASLSALTLFEAFGELVDASGGVVEYSDLLKRPLDAWKYLLLAIEEGEVSLTMSNLAINSVMIASSNEIHLAAFREHPEYHSFRGRIVQVRVPYLSNVFEEQGIYDAQIVPQIPKHVAPHTTYCAALWAVLTRLHKPEAEHYEDLVGACVVSLSPLEKADLLSEGKIPTRFEGDDAKRLGEVIPQVRQEWMRGMPYEGMIGASPREIRTLLLDAAAEDDEPCVSPMSFFAKAEEFCARTDYEFLQQETDEGYYDHLGFIGAIHQRWLDRVEDELRACSGLVDETRYLELFDTYVTHVSHWVKKERVLNPVTGAYEDPDAELMKSVEEKLSVEKSEAFRNELLSAIAAYAIDHPDEVVEYPSLFPHYIEQLRQAYFEEHRSELAEIAKAVLVEIEGEQNLEAEAKAQAKAVTKALIDNHGYELSSVQVALGELVAARYASL